jgi:hypothetical protein
MKYQITATVGLEKEGLLFKKVIKLTSEYSLTVKQIKEQCYLFLNIDEDKYIKKSEEVWQRGVLLNEANTDTDVFDQIYQLNPNYKLVLTKK